MQFSLRTALTAMTLLALGLGMYVEHGLLGIGLLVPPVALVAGALYLWRNGWRAAAIACLASYLAAWGMTEVWGSLSFERVAQEKLSAVDVNQPEPYRRLSFDPMRDRTRRCGPPPWYYLSRAHSPCPLVVYADYSWYRCRMCGSGGRSYVVWCGSWHEMASTFYWSC
jgi:hypothetical protein